VSFATITLCVVSQRVFIVVSVYFIMTQSGNFWINPCISSILLHLPFFLLSLYFLHHTIKRTEGVEPSSTHFRCLYEMEMSGQIQEPAASVPGDVTSDTHCIRGGLRSSILRREKLELCIKNFSG
jgi:hypothetical protein